MRCFVSGDSYVLLEYGRTNGNVYSFLSVDVNPLVKGEVDWLDRLVHQQKI